MTALGYCVRYAQKHLIDGKKNLIQIVDELEEVMQNKPWQHCVRVHPVYPVWQCREDRKYLHVLTDIEHLG